MKQKIAFIDRYLATGKPYPTESSCSHCEAMGCFPLKRFKNFKELFLLLMKRKSYYLFKSIVFDIYHHGIDNWFKGIEHDHYSANDGDWRFIKCSACGGSGVLG